jgi:hypothetical protein
MKLWVFQVVGIAHAREHRKDPPGWCWPSHLAAILGPTLPETLANRITWSEDWLLNRGEFFSVCSMVCGFCALIHTVLTIFSSFLHVQIVGVHQEKTSYQLLHGAFTGTLISSNSSFFLLQQTIYWVLTLSQEALGTPRKNSCLPGADILMGDTDNY